MEFLLDPEMTFLNHGSFGACPAEVFEEYRRFQLELERQPVEFLGRRFDGLLGEARAALAAYVGARADDLVFVPNATAGLNAVIRSLSLEPEDEVLTTAHEYGGLVKTWEFLGATLVRVEPGELAAAIGPRTRAVFLSHISSPTALVLPVEEACAAARAAGVLSIVDGAHAPGHVPLDLVSLGADVYAGNCHKWLCAPKGSAFLWARPEHHAWIDPLVVSWGWSPGAQFADKHGWQGTRDPAALLTVPKAIEAHGRLDWEGARALAVRARERLAAAGYPPLPGTPAPCMFAVRLPECDVDEVQRRLWEEHRIEVVVSAWEGRALLRVSLAPYNTEADVERLLAALPSVL